MKYSALFLLLFISSISFGYEKKVPSKIKDVTVFLSGAQINREGSVTIPKGQSELIFTGISPLLKRESLQAGSKSNITILSVHFETKTIEKERAEGDIKALEEKKQVLAKKITRLNAKIRVINTEEAMIEALAQIQNQMKDWTIDDVVKARAVINENLEGIKLKKISAQEEINTYNQELNKISQRINALSIVHTTLEPRIVVKVKAEKEIKAKLRISYFVANARWYPSYNLRVKNLDSPLVVDYQANISQQTGENWKNVKLTLSTNDPNQGGQKPELKPWYLLLNQQTQQRYTQSPQGRYAPTQFTKVYGRVTDQYGESLPFASVMVTGSTVGTVTDMEGHYQLNLPQGRNQLQVKFIGYNDVTINIAGEQQNIVMAENQLTLQEVAVISDLDIYEDEVATESVKYDDGVYSMEYAALESVSVTSMKQKRLAKKGISKNYNKSQAATRSVPVQVTQKENVVSAEFKIDEIYTVPSNSKHYTVSISNMEKKAHYQYYCAPKLDKDAFLTAQLTDWQDMNLLEGQANIFFEGTYVGSSLLDVKFIGDTLDISLGRDKRIIVEREKEKEFSKNKVIGDKAVKSIKWNIAVQNNKKQNINLILEDQFPLTKDARIQIDADDVTKGKVDDKTGFITWDLKIGGNKSQELDFKYKVTYPKGNQVYLE